MSKSPKCPKAGDANEQFGQGLVNSLLRHESLGMLKAVYGTVKIGKGSTFHDHRRVVMAWFKDLLAAQHWYFGESHRMFIQSRAGKNPSILDFPLTHVDQHYAGPVMVVASVTDTTTGDIAIELFRAMPAGLGEVEKRLSPKLFEIPHFNDSIPLGWNVWVRQLAGLRLFSIRGAVLAPSPNHTYELVQIKESVASDTVKFRLEIKNEAGPFGPGQTWIPVRFSMTGYTGMHAWAEIYSPKSGAVVARVPVQLFEPN